MCSSDLELSNFARTNLTSVKFDGSNLRGADFKGATIGRGTSFRGATMVNADLRGAKISGKVDFSGVDFSGANLAGVDLRNVIMDSRTKLTNAIGVDKNYLPREIAKGMESRRSFQRSTNELINMPNEMLLGEVNDSLINLKNPALRKKIDRDSVIVNISSIYDHYNDVPGISYDISNSISNIGDELNNLNNDLNELGTFNFSDGSSLDIQNFVKNNDRSGFIKSIRSSGKNVSPGKIGRAHV